MRVLVTAASKHGATWEIASAVRGRLREHGLDSHLCAPEEVGDLAEFGAVVLGSAIYAGRWLEPARALAERHAAALRDRRVWLFSSGPVGDPPKPAGDPPEAVALATRTGAVEHRVFTGRLDRERLGLGERAVVRALRAPEGDFRDWADVLAWADGIARVLHTDRSSV
jgi:menaquinone-dependent protoporphyrinogen oxidase